MTSKMRVGIGSDVHPLVVGRKLILGGVDIPFEKGLSGWSDGDVLVHAIMDALLGAAALGDIGTHFPPGTPEYKGISSLVLLAKVRRLLDERQWKIGNIDVMVMAEAPRLRDHMSKITQNLARVLMMDQTDISIKAGTNEMMGFVGHGEGIAAQAVALLESTKTEYKLL